MHCMLMYIAISPISCLVTYNELRFCAYIVGVIIYYYTYMLPMHTYIFIVTVLDQKTSDHLKNMTKSWPSGFTEKIIFNYKTFHFPGKIRDLPNWYNSESRGQEEASRTRRMSVLFTRSTTLKFVNALISCHESYHLVIKDSACSNYIESVTRQKRKSAPPILSTSHCEPYGTRLCAHARKLSYSLIY